VRSRDLKVARESPKKGESEDISKSGGQQGLVYFSQSQGPKREMDHITETPSDFLHHSTTTYGWSWQQAGCQGPQLTTPFGQGVNGRCNQK
jgi:hypothetical protein